MMTKEQARRLIANANALPDDLGAFACFTVHVGGGRSGDVLPECPVGHLALMAAEQLQYREPLADRLMEARRFNRACTDTAARDLCEAAYGDRLYRISDINDDPSVQTDLRKRRAVSGARWIVRQAGYDPDALLEGR